MNITLSNHLSYCPGVKRTLRLVDKLITEKPDHLFYMLGEIIHNEFVIRDLRSKGLRMIRSVDEVVDPGTVIIQSHGAPISVFKQLEAGGIPYIDATCPMVKVIHTRIQELEKGGYFPVIIGKKGHEEVKGIEGQVSRALVIGKEEDVTASLFSGIQRVGIVVQSTVIRKEAERLVARIREMVPEIEFINTICEPTTSRQEEIKEVSNRYDCILIIGSRTSANTNHLLQLAKKENSCVFLIDQPERINEIPIPPQASVFIASGASTPDYQIEAVVSRLKQLELSSAPGQKEELP